ncbi:hypothetical protein VP01_934g2 [Puccinia sorghi]|uniref:Uncharacterized protein n=1 Tax=Puccinia sorghi TaxID=27349 RepID=A0A0L6U8Z7_9BASI|nr:hypothetical protein VP01_934g2 [Puccinia sorghi]
MDFKGLEGRRCMLVVNRVGMNGCVYVRRAILDNEKKTCDKKVLFTKNMVFIEFYRLLGMMGSSTCDPLVLKVQPTRLWVASSKPVPQGWVSFINFFVSQIETYLMIINFFPTLFRVNNSMFSPHCSSCWHFSPNTENSLPRHLSPLAFKSRKSINNVEIIHMHLICYFVWNKIHMCLTSITHEHHTHEKTHEFSSSTIIVLKYASWCYEEPLRVLIAPQKSLWPSKIYKTLDFLDCPPESITHQNYSLPAFDYLLNSNQFIDPIIPGFLPLVIIYLPSSTLLELSCKTFPVDIREFPVSYQQEESTAIPSLVRLRRAQQFLMKLLSIITCPYRKKIPPSSNPSQIKADNFEFNHFQCKYPGLPWKLQFLNSKFTQFFRQVGFDVGKKKNNFSKPSGTSPLVFLFPNVEETNKAKGRIWSTGLIRNPPDVAALVQVGYGNNLQ